ncbi:lysosomal proton-coupled steroid conjugate and bile acid symporter SLC46A3-like [Clytia hemisphaerica]
MLKNSLVTSEPIIFLYSSIYYINLSILPQLVLQKVCLEKYDNGLAGNGTTSSSSLCEEKSSTVITNDMQKESSLWWFAILASSQIPSILTVLIWGPISDVIGRKKAILLVPIMSILQNIIFLLCSYYMNSSIIYLCVGMFMACLFGEFPGVLALSCAFIADVTTGRKAKSRTSRMALVDCAVNLAGVPAGLFAGQLLKHLGFTAVFGLSIGFNVIILLYIIFLLPDTRAIQIANELDFKQSMEIKPGKKSTTKDIVISNKAIDIDVTDIESPEVNASAKPATNPTDNDVTDTSNQETRKLSCDLFMPHKQIYLVYKLLSSKGIRHLILPPLLAFTFIIYAFVGELTLTSLYIKNEPLALEPDFIGYYYASQATIRCFGCLATTQIATRILKASDINVLLFGVVSQMVSYILIGLSKSELSVFMANLSSFGIPVALTISRSYTSKQVPPEQVGTLMAAFESIDALSFTTNLMSIEVYNATLSKYAGAVWFFLAGCSFIGFALTLGNKFYLLKKKKSADINGNTPGVTTNKAVSASDA